MTPKQLVLTALAQYRGDDIHRARLAFKNYTNEQMDAEYGQSGKTPRQILAEYEAHNSAVDDAVALVNTKL